MDRSQVLSEKAIKRMGLDKKKEESPLSKEVVREWETEQEYWVEWEKELNFSLLRVIIDVFCVKNTHVGAYTCVCKKKVVSLQREL